MRERISKAKAFIAVRNYYAANNELEGIRRESSDPSVLAVVNVLLMNSYLEQGDYKRAQDFLNEAYNIQKTTKPGAAASYFAVASQIVKGSRNRVERYRALGLNPSDRTLPLEAINDLEKMRETLEIVVTQTKEISKDKAKSPDAMALLEEATTSRSMIARDDYDARKWQDEMADSREDLASSHSVVLSAVTEAPAYTAPSNQTVAANTQPNSVIADAAYKPNVPTANTTANPQPLVRPTVMSQPINEPPKSNAATQYVPDAQRNRVNQDQPANSTTTAPNTPASKPEQPASQPAKQPVNQPSTQPAEQPVKGPATNTADKPAAADSAKDSGPVSVGSLLPYVTKQLAPAYPAAAKTMRTTGIVTIAVIIDEQGNVAEIKDIQGPTMLQSAAKDVIRKWRFKPFTKDGQAVRASGFVSFNFAM